MAKKKKQKHDDIQKIQPQQTAEELSSEEYYDVDADYSPNKQEDEIQTEDSLTEQNPNPYDYEEYETAFDADLEDKVSAYSTQRRLQKNKMERKIRQSKMWINRLRALLRLVIIVILIFIGYKLLRLPMWYLDENIFSGQDNKSLEIVNNKIVPKQKILSALRRTTIPHTPIYRFETDEIKSNILQLDPVEDVFVRRFWFPARLQIIIEEKIPSISISPAPNVAPIAFFSHDGKLIGRDYLPLDKSFKTIFVISYGTRGDDYRYWKPEKIKQIEKLAKVLEINSGENIEYLDFRNPRDIYAKIKTVSIRLGELDDGVFDRIKRLPSILPQVKTLDKPIKYIDLRWKNTNYIKLGEVQPPPTQPQTPEVKP